MVHLQIPGFYPLDANSTPLVVTTKSGCRTDKMPGGKDGFQLRTAGLEALPQRGSFGTAK